MISLAFDLPETFIHLIGHVVSPEDTKTIRPSIVPEALERATVGPKYLSITTVYIFTAFLFNKIAHLTRVFLGIDSRGLERKLGILDAQL